MAYNDMSVSVLGGKNLHNTEWLTKQDPYAICYYNGRQVHKTKVADDAGKNPAWNEKFVLHVQPGYHELDVRVWNWNVGKDDEIGSTRIRFEKALHSGFEDFDADLFLGERRKGSVRVLFDYPFARNNPAGPPGAYPQPGGYGGPPSAYPQPGGYGGPPGAYGAPQGGGYGAPPGGGYGAPPGGGYGAPPGGGYGAPPPGAYGGAPYPPPGGSYGR